MRAMIVDGGEVRLGTAPDPVPGPHEALVRVAGISLNYGELAFGLRFAPDGTVPGYDAAGVVVAAAADGTGPVVGTPVLSVGGLGGWAEVRAVPTDLLGVVPAGADPATMAATATAGATALRALRRLGSLLGRRVLITGATGGVGRFAVQLARRSGAHVIAVAAGAEVSGAAQTIAEPAALTEPVHGVIDLVGGGFLATAYAKLASGGTLVSVGHAAGALAGFDYLAMFADPAALGRSGRRIVELHLPAERDLPPDLTWLAGEVASGALEPSIAWRGDWRDLQEAAELLLARKLHGKAALVVS